MSTNQFISLILMLLTIFAIKFKLERDKQIAVARSFDVIMDQGRKHGFGWLFRAPKE